MTEQYEQVNSIDEALKAESEDRLWVDPEKGGINFPLKAHTVSFLLEAIEGKLFYRKPEQVELVEWKYLLEGADEVFKYVRPTVKLDSDYWYRTGYIIKGVRVKA